MKQKIRLTEQDLHRIIMESAKKLFGKSAVNEVNLHYGTSNKSSVKYDMYDNPRDNGHSYDYENEYTNEIKEDYVELARRLERLTNEEWDLQRHESSSYSSEFKYGDYCDDFRGNEGIDFVCKSNFFGNNYKESAAIKDKAVSMVSLFFKGYADVSSYEQDRCFCIEVHFKGKYSNYDRSHKNSRNLTFGKNYVGYPKKDGKKISGYANPYPNNINGRGAQQEEDYLNSTDGNPWFTADRDKHSVRDEIDKWRDPEWVDLYMDGYFDEE